MIGIGLSLAAVLVAVSGSSVEPRQPAARVVTPPKVASSSLPATDTRDARVILPGSGGMKISMPTFSAAPSASAATSSDGLIAVPDNTLGPGEALWQRNDRIDSELKLARAEAFLAERVSTLPLSENQWGWGGIGSVWGGGGWGVGGWGGWNGTWSAPAGWAVSRATSPAYSQIICPPNSAPARGTVIQSSAGLAQRQFAEAARPKINHIENARAEAVRQFGRVAAGAAVPGGPGGTGAPPVIARKGRPDAGANTPAQSPSRAQPASRKGGGRPRR